MDARDVCRRLNCSPRTLSEWLDRGCPVMFGRPHVRFDMNQVKQWLADNKIEDWPKENDRDLDVPIRSIFKALQRKELTPDEAEKIITNLGAGIWG